MERGKRSSKALGTSNNKIYLDLKDIVRENVLPFVPAKSLFRFESVCRDWKLQVKTPFFAHNQSLSCDSVLGLFVQESTQPPKLISFAPNACGVPDPHLSFMPVTVEIRSSANGLLLCRAHVGDNAYYVCNPVTKQYKKLPKSNAQHGHDPAMVLIFEPSRLNFEADFKVVVAFPSNDFDDATEFEIYSSDKQTWKISGEICFAARSPMANSGVYANGAVYWMEKRGGILMYDVIKDRSMNLHYHYGTLGIMNGKLCAGTVNGHMVTLHELVNIHTNTMQMHSRVRMWEEKQRINIDREVIGGNRKINKVLFIGGDILVVKGDEYFYSYDIKTRETKVVENMPIDYNDSRFVPYVNSLVSI